MWPPPSARLHVVATGARLQPGWDGQVRPVVGVVSAGGSGVVGVQPGMPEGTVDSVAGVAALLAAPVWDAAFRWCESPAPLPDTGSWVPRSDARVPDWLKPFNGDVLCVFSEDESSYLAGVGIKRHDPFGWELSVGTEPAAQGRGFARALVATAARRVIDEGAVPTYLHDFRNAASAKVAEAAGFPDRGWRVLGTAPSG